jgi:hypothetical protein
MLKRILALRLEIEMFMNKNGKVVAEHSDKWLWDLALVCDISHHENECQTSWSKETHF